VFANEDAYAGDAQFTLFADGHQIGGTYTATALHSSGQWQEFDLTADLGSTGPSQVVINFVNDAWGGTDATDRNLYIEQIAVSGHVFAATSAVNTANVGFTDPNDAPMYVSGSLTFTTTGSAPVSSSPTPSPAPAPAPAPAPTPAPVSSDLTLDTQPIPKATIVGTGGNDVLTGTSGNDVFNGGHGTDTMSGGTGDDTYINPTGDVVIEQPGQGTDTVYANWNYTLPANVERLVATGGSNLTLNGNDLDNPIIGNDGANTINGGAGNDRIVGGLGPDLLTGGTGNDQFIYRSVAEKGDTIRDFHPGEDVLDLRMLMTSIGYAGTDPVKDGVVKLVAAGTDGSAVMIDPDGSAGTQVAQKLVTLEHVLPSTVKVGVDLLWH
jgi:Ca-dependent carbohydrate-binding module xylan-binding/RTX calcium-binding nonapeptide repeat (4 copies)